MGSKIFVSYKYRDFGVKALEGYSTEESYTRGYVDFLQDKLELSEHIYKGERGDNDLSQYNDHYIEEHLKPMIADSSVTVILISPNMRVPGMRERDQWIPWEMSYSLKEITREDRTSHTNAILGVVLPDENSCFDYVVQMRHCCAGGCRYLNTANLFTILRENTFNLKRPQTSVCAKNDVVQYGEYSYMPIITWDEFILNPSGQIERVCKLRDDHKDDYNIFKLPDEGSQG